MGNSNGGTPTPTPSKYTQIRIEQNELLSNLIIVEDQNSKQRLMIKQMNIANELQYHRILKQMKLRRIVSEKKIGRYLIQIKEIQTKQSNQICGKNYKIIIYLEYLETNLKNIYNERKHNNQPFTEQQILNLLKVLVNNLIILNDNSYKNLHLYKQAIFLTHQQSFKIMDSQLSNKVHPYYELLNNVPTKKGTYLAPELLDEIRAKNGDFYQTPKADIFTLAVIVLELCTFNSYDLFYDYQRMRVDLEGLREAVEQIEYSNELKCILEMMLVEEEEERIGLITLKELLQGNDLKSSEEASTFKSSTTNPRKKNTTRTFISRSKPQSKISKESSQHKLHTEFNVSSKDKKDYYPIASNKQREDTQYQGEYSSQRDAFHSQQQDVKANSKRSSTSNQITYKPIQPLLQNNQHTFPNYQIKQTPRNSFDYDHKGSFTNKLRMKQFQTPVNMLYQNYGPEPESTPIRKVEALNSAQQQQQTNTFTVEYFNSKTYGQHVFSNGAKYQGEFNPNSEFDGNGMLYYPSGKLCYSGSWQANCFHGFGVLYNQSPTDSGQSANYQNFNFVDLNNWNYYQGEFDCDKKEGFGTLYMINGDKFSGCFKNDAVQGFGTFYLAKEKRNINGIWVQNVLKK